ncbi:MAG: DUF1294 domain-containing protein [Clostridiales bacterium]|nr:DUF1294 domain-containing protein [Clostridiales bacterium]
MEQMYQVGMIGLLIWNMYAFLLMFWDKRQSVSKGKRISEKRLLWINFLAGGLGLFAGSHIWRHKTRKKPFPILLPMGATITVMIALFLFEKQ